MAWTAVSLLMIALAASYAGTKPAGAASPTACVAYAGSDLAALEACFVLRPNDVVLMLELGSRYERAARIGEAVAVYQRAMVTDPLDAESHLRFAALIAEKDPVAAERAAARAQALRPNSARVAGLLTNAGTVARSDR